MSDIVTGLHQLTIDDTLVHRLLINQFPQWADFPIQPVLPGGWDNRTFRLGESMVVRQPRAADYAGQVEKEQRWLPRLAPLLPFAIPAPLAIGEPAHGYPWRWSIYRWIEGDSAAIGRIADARDFATDLAKFLIALQRIDATGGPQPGAHNFYRGGPLTNYGAETRKAIAALNGKIDVVAAAEVWEAALSTTWKGLPVWVHGDISLGNLLVKEGRLSAVIDFGQLGTQVRAPVTHHQNPCECQPWPATHRRDLLTYGNVNPDRAFTAEISLELIAPVALRSNLKFAAVVVCPERAFTPLMSLELTERVLLTSPTRKPTDVAGGFTELLTFASVIVTR